MSRPDYVVCIKSENPRYSLCNRNISSEFSYQSIEHAEKARGGSLELCRECDKVIEERADIEYVLARYEEIAVKHGAVRTLHGEFLATKEQADKIMDEYNKTYPQYAKLMENNRRIANYPAFFREVEGKITVGTWSGHGEGGTNLQISLTDYPKEWLYELPEDLKRWIGKGKKVIIMLAEDS